MVLWWTGCLRGTEPVPTFARTAMSVQSEKGVAEIGLPELLFFLLCQVMAGNKAAVGEPVFRQADLDQLWFDAVDVKHQIPRIVSRRISSMSRLFSLSCFWRLVFHS